ncbi:MAG TPA: hypothetical protein VGC67_10735 [Cellulomonas sp.]
MSTDEELVEIWGDRVSLRDLVVALAVCSAATVAAVLIGRAVDGSEFFWGLGGAVVGFVAAVLIVQPKRDVQIVADPQAVADVPVTAIALPSEAPGSPAPGDPPEGPSRPAGPPSA